MLQHLSIQFPLHRLWEVEIKRKLQTFRSKSGWGRLQDDLLYKMTRLHDDLKILGIWENWLLK